MLRAASWSSCGQRVQGVRRHKQQGDLENMLLFGGRNVH